MLLEVRRSVGEVSDVWPQHAVNERVRAHDDHLHGPRGLSVAVAATTGRE